MSFKHITGLAACMLSASAAEAAAPADYVFQHGSVYTVEADQPWAEAVAVKDHQIVYVGTQEGAKEHIGAATKIVDLAGGMLLPGFIDSHVHSATLSTSLDAALVDRTAKPEGIVALLRQYVDKHPEQKLIRGTGWIVETFGPEGPTKAMIDKIVPDRPALLKSIDGHFLWVNSKTLEIAGITADTPDPEPGKSWFQRLPGSREPSGFIVEVAAMAMITGALARNGYDLDSPERLRQGYEMGLPELSAAGVTTVFDAGMGDEPQTFAVLHTLEQQGRLSVRIFGSHRYRPEEDSIDRGEPVAKYIALRNKYDSDLLGLRMMKILVDGSENGHTAYMLEPYADQPGYRGEPIISVPDLNKLVLDADTAGIDVHMHVVGDAGARIALDAIEQAEARNGSRDRRDALTHAILVHPDDIRRFRKLNVIWQTTPSWAAMSPRNQSVLTAMGPQRFAERMYPLGDAIGEGIVMNFSSDFGSITPGNIYKPLDHMEVAHTRRPLDKPNVEPMPRDSQRLNVPDIIRAYTINGAYMLRMEKKIGSIKVGKQADLVVLQKSLFDVPPTQIHNVKIRMTMMDGKVTYAGNEDPK